MKRRLQIAGSTAVVVLALGVLALGVLARHVSAYGVIGPTWGVRQVSYYINPQNLYVPESTAVAAITSAASAWNGVANIDLAYAGYTSGSSLTLNGVNEVFFRNDANGFIAEAYWWYDGTGRLLDVDIVFHQNYRLYAGNSGCNGDGFYIENAGAHEFGHLLGLAHSTVEAASMWPYEGACETLRESLDDDDIAGLRSMYPDSTNPAPPTKPAPPKGRKK